MTRKRDRVFALSLAVLFFITAFGFSFYVIWQLHSQNKSSNNTSQQSTNNSSQQNAATTCTGSPPEAALPAPDIYKPSGPVTSLQITDLETGSGPAAKSGNCLIVKYYGTLASDGTLFDESFTKNIGFEFPLGQGQVIPGWDQGLVGMKVGGTRRLVIPPALAYRDQAAGTIPPNSTLVFVVKLIAIKN